MEEYKYIDSMNQKKANEIINELNIYELFKEFKIQANLIGSVRTGLL